MAPNMKETRKELPIPETLNPETIKLCTFETLKH